VVEKKLNTDKRRIEKDTVQLKTYSDNSDLGEVLAVTCATDNSVAE
jgi:hypothetical protein